MQISVHSIIEKYLGRKFRNSRSYSTKSSYKVAINRFVDYLRVQHNLDLNQLLRKIKETKEIESIDLLDDYYSFLSKDKKRLRSSTIRLYLIVAKDFLNSEGCKIYSEDLNQRFRLPKKIQVYEEGLTKETINRIIRLANPKLATIILMICSSGTRIAETIQIRLADVDFTKTPTTIKLSTDTERYDKMEEKQEKKQDREEKKQERQQERQSDSNSFIPFAAFAEQETAAGQLSTFSDYLKTFFRMLPF